jgi:hypothetical protein
MISGGVAELSTGVSVIVTSRVLVGPYQFLSHKSLMSREQIEVPGRPRDIGGLAGPCHLTRCPKSRYVQV